MLLMCSRPNPLVYVCSQFYNYKPEKNNTDLEPKHVVSEPKLRCVSFGLHMIGPRVHVEGA